MTLNKPIPHRKCITLSKFKYNGKWILRLENILLRLGYTQSDYKIVTYSESYELVSLNKELSRDLKVLRNTGKG